MPNRILKESVNESRGLSGASPFAQDLYKRLITYADDYGRFNGDVEIMRARLYPRELESVIEEDVEEALVELVGVGKVRLYTGPASSFQARGVIVYGYFPNWDAHQRLRDSKPKYPAPDQQSLNDWALRRFVPVALKRRILERDDFTCQACGACFRLVGVTVERAQRLLSGVLHFDHVVPVLQGGRATEGNLRLLCAACNLRRRKRVSIEEMAALACADTHLPQTAPACGDSPLARARVRNPNPKENFKPEAGDVSPTPLPPSPQAGQGEGQPTNQRRRRRSGGDVAAAPQREVPADLVPPTEADRALWSEARDRLTDGWLPANRDKAAAFEPLGRDPSGWLWIRAPAWAASVASQAQLAACLVNAGDPFGQGCVLVEGT